MKGYVANKGGRWYAGLSLERTRAKECGVVGHRGLFGAPGFELRIGDY
jgi:hypothetical protein